MWLKRIKVKTTYILYMLLYLFVRLAGEGWKVASWNNRVGEQFIGLYR